MILISFLTSLTEDKELKANLESNQFEFTSRESNPTLF